MKADELTPCAACGKGLMHAGSITFFRLSIGREVIDINAARRVQAMEMYFGGALPIARTFADEDLTKQLCKPAEVLICEPCSMEPLTLWDLLPKED